VYVDKSFSDSKNHWGIEAIKALSARNIIKGKGNSFIDSKIAISTRAEVVQMLYNLLVKGQIYK
jgi:hypothetical protein